MPLKIYSDEQIAHIRDQSLIYRCACPAQICVAIDGMRELLRFEENCLETNEGEQEIHLLIKNVAENNHRALEDCLTQVLTLEGWNMDQLTMPILMRQKMFSSDG